MSSSEELAAFVTARLDEEEAAAEQAARKRKPPWRAETYADGLAGSVNNSPESASPSAHDRGHVAETISGTVATHIALHDPARALREVQAKRQRLALYLDAREALAASLKDAPALDDPAVAHSYVRERINVNQASGGFAAFEMCVRLDAAIWCDHPGYRPEWAPATA